MPPVLHAGEVYVDGTGRYIGDFSQGLNNGNRQTPLGWTHVTASADSHGFWIYQNWWEDPNYQADNPIGPISYDFPTQQCDIVAEPTGPAGKEDQNAGQLWGAGAPGHMTWVGADPSLVKGIGPLPAQIGWMPQHDQQWVFEGWFRAIPDAAYYGQFLQPEETSGYSCEGFEIGFGMAMYGYATTYAGDPLVLSSEWQHLYNIVAWPYVSCTVGGTVEAGVPTVMLRGNDWYYQETHTFDFLGTPITDTRYAPRYQVQMKELHLYPYGAPLLYSGIYLDPVTIG